MKKIAGNKNPKVPNKGDSVKKYPKLRFPEFIEEWVKKKLGEIAQIIGGGTPDTNIEEYWNGNIQWFTPTEIKSNYVSKSNRTITELGLKKSSAKLLPKGTLLLTTRATIGDVAIATEECTTNQGFQSLIVNEGFDNVFISNWIKLNKKELLIRAKGSTFPEIGKAELSEIKIFLPSLVEQRKLASFLSLLDDRISTQNKIIKRLEALIGGISEKLFKQQVRFKDGDGNSFPDWVETKLGDVLNIQGGYVFKSNSFNQGTTKVIRIGDIKPAIDLQKFSGVYSNEIPDSKYIVKKNDFVIALSGATFGKVGKIINDSIAYINQRVATFRTTQCLEFFYQLIRTDTFKQYLNSIPSTSAQPNISNDDILKFKTTIPSIKEQTLIANFLCSMEKKIENEKKILQQYEAQKKYLLQNMFI